MYKLRFLLAVYARDFYRVMAALLATGAAVTLAASFTAWAGAVTLVFAICVGAIAAAAVTLGITVLNVVVASGLHRGIESFEAAYDSYRRANNIPDIFYEEMDMEEAAERAAAGK